MYIEKVKEYKFICCGWKINKMEIAIFVFAVALPLFFDWIPFSYGPLGPWCWIRVSEKKLHFIQSRNTGGVAMEHAICSCCFSDVSSFYGITVPAEMWYQKCQS